METKRTCFSLVSPKVTYINCKVWWISSSPTNGKKLLLLWPTMLWISMRKQSVALSFLSPVLLHYCQLWVHLLPWKCKGSLCTCCQRWPWCWLEATVCHWFSLPACSKAAAKAITLTVILKIRLDTGAVCTHPPLTTKLLLKRISVSHILTQKVIGKHWLWLCDSGVTWVALTALLWVISGFSHASL